MKRYTCALVSIALLTVSLANAQSVDDASMAIERLGRIKAPPALEPLFRGGYARSPTLRTVADDIAASGWLVFLQPGQCPEAAAVACLLHFVGRFENAPYMRVIVKHQSRHPDNVIASLAHELQHVREVITAGNVTDAAAMRSLFKRIGYVSVQRAGLTTYETSAAVTVGEVVWWELLRGKKK